MYAADFESTSKLNYDEENKVRVWGWSVNGIDNLEESYWGTGIESFFKWMIEMDDDNKEIYFHNLRFDGQFIISHLLNNGWKHVSHGKQKSKTFTTLIGEDGSFFQIIMYVKVYKTRTFRINIKDSLKKLPIPLKDIAESFELDTLKGEIDYTKLREEGYEPTDEEVEYMLNDSKILAQALNEVIIQQGLSNMTISGDAMNYYKSTIGETNFKRLFPIVSRDADSYIRNSYKGGFVYVNPKYQNKEINKSISYDVNSLYPSIMRNEGIPYGSPIKFKGEYKLDETYPLYIQKIEVDFKLKEGYIPTIQTRHLTIFGASTEYITDTKGETLTLYLTSVDLELFKKHYEVCYINYVDGYKFRRSSSMFKNYVDHWNSIKETSSGGRKQLAKLMLNSLYGRFAMKPERVNKVPYLDENNVVKYKLKKVRDANIVYTAAATFITSYARKETIQAAQSNYDRFIYADTDSMHLEGHSTAKSIIVHNYAIGAWAMEGKFNRSKFLRPKTYIREDLNKELDIACSGLPNSVRSQVTFDNFKLGAKYHGKLSLSVVNGGSLLKETFFTISEVI